MLATTRTSILLALLACAPCIAPSLARAEEAPAAAGAARIAQAERLAEAAFDAYTERDFERAVELYQQALAAAPGADIVYNLARVYDLGLGDAKAAIQYYRRYVAHTRAQQPRSGLARQRIRELEESAANPPSPSADVSRPPSSGASHFPSSPVERPTAHPPQPAAASPAASWSAREVAAASLAGAGLASLGVGIGFGIAAFAQRDSWRSGCNGDVCSSPQAVEAARSAGRQADVATLALAAGGGLVALGATLWWLAPPHDEQSAQVALGLSPAADGSPLGCVLSGTF